MEKLSVVLKKPLDPLVKEQPTSAGGEDDLVITNDMMMNVNKVFSTIHASYPAWYEKYYSNRKNEQQAKRIWLTGIKLLNSEQVKIGLQRMVLECDFPPRLKEFMSLCQRVDGLVDVDLAWGEALIGRYSHPVIKVAAELTGIFELKQASYESALLKKQFEYYFLKVRDNFSQNKPLTVVDEVYKNNSQNVLSKVEQQAEDRVKARIKQQGIDEHTARESCLALLGIKRH